VREDNRQAATVAGVIREFDADEALARERAGGKDEPV